MTKPKLSPKAQKLWARVKSSEYYYPIEHGPEAMKELIDAGLVTTTGRVTEVRACYVPEGTKGFRFERFPGEK